MRQIAVACAVTLASLIGISAQTPPTSGGVSVSGTTYDVHPGTNPQKPSEVVLTKSFDGVGGFIPPRRAPLQPDGSFTFLNVLPGRYSFTANPGVNPSVDVEVGEVNLNGIRVPVMTTTDVAVVAKVDDGSPLPQPVGIHWSYGATGMSSGLGPTGGILPLKPGRVHRFVRLPAGYYVKEMRAGSTNLLQRPLELQPGAAALTAEITLTRTAPPPATTTIRGRLGAARAGVTVELADIFAAPPFGRLAATTRAASDGSFEFRGVPRSIYNVNLPPAIGVIEGVIASGDIVDATIELPDGTVVSGNPVPVLDTNGRGSPYRMGVVSIRFRSNSTERVVRVKNSGFWTALPAGSYSATIEGLPSTLVVSSFRAGSADLLTSRFVVPAGRPAEAISLVLKQR